MARWELQASADVPGDGGELRLYQRGDEFSLRLVGLGELMTSRTHGSEDALGRMVCEALASRPQVRVLIGGLGMGFTLAAALAALGADAIAEVAELVPEVITWNEGPLGACAGYPARDPRARLQAADVGQLLVQANGIYDAVLLDVDNGPEGMTRRANDRLYAFDGLMDAYQALKPGGTLAVWSASPDNPFLGRLRKSGFDVEEKRVRAHRSKGSRHLIWFAKRPTGAGRF